MKKNIGLFIVLLVLTVVALLAWNYVSKKNNSTAKQTASMQPSPTVTNENPLRDMNAKPSSDAGNILVSTTSATTKGGIPLDTPSVTPTPSKDKEVSYKGSIVLSDKGFTPSTLTINQGTSVVFVNSSSKKMQLALKGQTLNGFNMSEGISKNGVLEYRFTVSGTWNYTNAVSPSLSGTIIVK